MAEQTGKSPVVSNELGGFNYSNIFVRWFCSLCVDNGFGTYSEVERYIDTRDTSASGTAPTGASTSMGCATCRRRCSSTAVLA